MHLVENTLTLDGNIGAKCEQNRPNVKLITVF